MLASIIHIWRCALSGRRDRLLDAAAASIAAESVLIVLNRGDCPLGSLQERAGDPIPLFELVLPPRAAKAAVPVLGAVALGGIALVASRGWAATVPSRAGHLAD
jgi:hypothetical protein